MSQVSIKQAMQIALESHRAGRLAEAEGIYRQVLAQVPGHWDALNGIGVLAAQMGRTEAAVEYFSRAIRCKADSAEAHCNLGCALSEQGKFEAAEAACRRAIQLKPDYAEAHCNLANALTSTGRFEEAVVACRRAIELRPRYPEAFCNLGHALTDLGHFDEGIAACRKAIELRPEMSQAHLNLAAVLFETGQLDESISSCRRVIQMNPNRHEGYVNLASALIAQKKIPDAIAACERAIQLNPECADGYTNLGAALHAQNKFREAVAACQQAVRLQPGFAEARYNLGNSLNALGQADEAVLAYQKAIELKPDYVEAHNNLGVALRGQGKFGQAIEAYREAIRIKPAYAEAHLNLAHALLLSGNWSTGWAEYEWRWKCDDFPSRRRNFAQLLWEGEELDGRTILLHAEQGLGDTIQFVRYVSKVAARGGKVMLECQPELHRLLQGASGLGTVIARGQPLPDFDLHCPLLSLPRAFGATPELIPMAVPYLAADALQIEIWGEHIAASDAHLNVGLAWAGSPAHINDARRSMELSQLTPLAAARSVRFYSLQKGPAAGQIATPGAGMQLIDFADKLVDFADTAALIANLDLVITVDTAVAHLAGAMGKPVWVMLPFVPDWRWLLDREDSPWYPTMRLFRQTEIGQWDEVIARVAKCLGELSERTVHVRSKEHSRDDAGQH